MRATRLRETESNWNFARKKSKSPLGDLSIYLIFWDFLVCT